MEMSYNSEIQKKSGVESIISNTFMNKNVTVSGETETIQAKAKIQESYILVVPNLTISDMAKELGITAYIIKDASQNSISANQIAATGYTFTNDANNNQYTIAVLGDVNGDGQIKASDYMKIKNYIMGSTDLSGTEQVAADANNDGAIKASDYMKIKNYIMGTTQITLNDTVTSGKTMSYADIIMKAAEESGISPYSIAIKIIQEVGRQGSSSVSGNYPGYEGYYNFFNWGASDGSNAIEKGLIYAKAQGWNNQYTAIVEGAKKLADGYTSVGQNTAYFYKFDVIDDSGTGLYWHQYMTNVQDPSSQAKTLYNTYAKNNILDLSLNFAIPVYKEMPNSCLLPSEIDRNAPTSYYINGTDVRLRSTPEINSGNILGVLSKDEIVTLIEENSGTANNYIWSKIKRANGTEGYVANEFLTKCNT